MKIIEIPSPSQTSKRLCQSQTQNRRKHRDHPAPCRHPAACMVNGMDMCKPHASKAALEYQIEKSKNAENGGKSGIFDSEESGYIKLMTLDGKTPTFQRDWINATFSRRISSENIIGEQIHLGLQI